MKISTHFTQTHFARGGECICIGNKSVLIWGRMPIEIVIYITYIINKQKYLLKKQHEQKRTNRQIWHNFHYVFNRFFWINVCESVFFLVWFTFILFRFQIKFSFSIDSMFKFWFLVLFFFSGLILEIWSFRQLGIWFFFHLVRSLICCSFLVYIKNSTIVAK